MGRGQQAAQGSLGNCAGQHPRGPAPAPSRMERAGEPSDPKEALTTTYPPKKTPQPGLRALLGAPWLGPSHRRDPWDPWPPDLAAALPTAGGKELSQRMATNSWRSEPLCSRRGPSGGSCPGWRQIKGAGAPNCSPRTATCSAPHTGTRPPPTSPGSARGGSALRGNCFVN